MLLILSAMYQPLMILSTFNDPKNILMIHQIFRNFLIHQEPFYFYYKKIQRF